MTETEWLDCTDPTPMLEYLLGKVSDRKLRLYGCACVRRIWHLLLYEGREALEVSEQYGDDKVLDQVLREARLALEQETPNRAETPEEMAAWATILAADDAVSWAESIGI